MRSLFYPSFFLFALSGCLANNSLSTSSIAQTNIYQMSKVELGMGEDEVLQILRRPYSQEIFAMGEDLYHVWFYITRQTALGQSQMLPQNLTPLTFKNGVLVGMGYAYYDWLVSQENAVKQKPIPAPQKKASPPDESKELEKALKSTDPSSNAPAQPAPPAQPAKPAKSTFKVLSMCSMSKSKSPEEEAADKRSSHPDAPKQAPPLQEEDNDMLEEEAEQNFNYW